MRRGPAVVAQGRPRRGRVETEPRLPSQEPTRGGHSPLRPTPRCSRQFFPMWATKSPGRPVPVMPRNGLIFGGTRQRRGSAWRGAFTQTRIHGRVAKGKIRLSPTGKQSLATFRCPCVEPVLPAHLKAKETTFCKILALCTCWLLSDTEVLEGNSYVLLFSTPQQCLIYCW